MTGRSVSWTDPRAVSEVLARLDPRRRPVVTTAVRAMGTPVRPAVAVSHVAATVAVPAQPPAPKVIPELVHTGENPVDRFDALLAWTLDHFACSGVFVADDNGLTLAAHGISEAHVALVGPLLSSLVRVRTIEGIDALSGTLRIGQQVLSWVECQTPRGGFCLGLMGDEPVLRAPSDLLTRALQSTVETL